jgi:hypothetical protein
MAFKRESPISTSEPGADSDIGSPPKKSKTSPKKNSGRSSAREKWTDDQIELIMELKEAGKPWRCVPNLFYEC